MQRATFIVLLAGFVLAVIAESDNNLPEKVKTFNTVLKKYDQELDRVVPFKEIQKSISGLDLMSTNYNGECTTMIDKAGDLGHRAIDNYYRGTDLLLRWSTNAKRVLGLVLARHDTLTEDRFREAVGTTINKGFKAFNESLGNLDSVVDQLEEMQGKLEPIPDKLQAELKKIQQQHDDDVKNKRESGEFIKKGLKALSKLVTFVLEYAKVPDASQFDLDEELHISGIPDKIIEGKLIPDADQKLKIVEAYYKVLTKTVVSATANVTKVKDEFKNSFVDQLHPWIPESDSIKEYSNNKNKDDNESNHQNKNDRSNQDNSDRNNKNNDDCNSEKENSEEKVKGGSGEEDKTARLIEEVRNLLETLKQITERFERSTKGSYKLQSIGGSGDKKEGIFWPHHLKSGQRENKEGIFWPDSQEDSFGSLELKSGQGNNMVPDISVMAAEIVQIMDETVKDREEQFWQFTSTARPSRRYTTSRD